MMRHGGVQMISLPGYRWPAVKRSKCSKNCSVSLPPLRRPPHLLSRFLNADTPPPLPLLPALWSGCTRLQRAVFARFRLALWEKDGTAASTLSVIGRTASQTSSRGRSEPRGRVTLNPIRASSAFCVQSYLHIAWVVNVIEETTLRFKVRPGTPALHAPNRLPTVVTSLGRAGPDPAVHTEVRPHQPAVQQEGRLLRHPGHRGPPQGPQLPLPLHRRGHHPRQQPPLQVQRADAHAPAP